MTPAPTKPDPSGASTSRTKTPSSDRTPETSELGLRLTTRIDIPGPLNLVMSNSGNDVPKQALQFKNLSWRYKKCPWPSFSHQSPENPPHLLFTPQNEPGAITSGSGSRTHQCKEPRLCIIKTLLQKLQKIPSYIDLHSRPDHIQLHPDPGH